MRRKKRQNQAWAEHAVTRSDRLILLGLLTALLPACSLSHNVDLPGSSDQDDGSLISGPGSDPGTGSQQPSSPSAGSGGATQTDLSCLALGGAGGSQESDATIDFDAPEEGGGDLDESAQIPLPEGEINQEPRDCGPTVVK